MPHKARQPPPERRRLTPADVSKVVCLIQDWPATRITWPLLVSRVAAHVGHKWTRQALEKHEAIKAAYQGVRDGKRASARGAPVDPAEIVMGRRVEALQQEVERLRRQLAAYEERFVRYEYHAAKNGLTPGQLGAPLPPIDRGRTDV